MPRLNRILRYVPPTRYTELVKWHDVFLGNISNIQIDFIPAQDPNFNSCSSLQPTFVAKLPLHKKLLLEQSCTNLNSSLGYRIIDPLGSIWFMQPDKDTAQASLSAFAIKSYEIELLKNSLNARFDNRLEFILEQHGKGPLHYSTGFSNLVFEIYPASKFELEGSYSAVSTYLKLTISDNATEIKLGLNDDGKSLQQTSAISLRP